MKRKKSVSKRSPKKNINIIQKDLNLFEKEINHDVYEVEKWVIARRKFFIKLGFVALLILVLFVISEFYLTVAV